MSTTLSGAVVPLIQKNPGTFLYSSLYLPSVAGSTGLIVPAVGSVIVNGSTLQTVTSVNLALLTFTLADVLLGNADDGLSSVVSYGNDLFRAFYDTRSNPYRLSVSERVIIYGGAPSTYQVVRYPSDPVQKTPISRYYDATGTYVSPLVPLERLSPGVNSWICPACQMTIQPADNEELGLEIYNDVGTLVATVSLFAKQSAIINDAFAYQPRIVSIAVQSTQKLATGDCYIFERQSFDNLDLQAILTYQDGSTRLVNIDSKQCFLYGQEDFIASYGGLRQTMMIKYFLSSDEVAVGTDLTDGSISIEFNVVVVANKSTATVKLSVVPEWNAATAQYVLRYFYYSTNHQACVDATSYISIISGTYTGNNYINTQSFVVSLDLSKIDPTTYSASVIYTQNIAIKLQPQITLVRYTLQDALSSPYVYGQDSTNSRRPVLFYDASLNQYFIPSGIFTNLQAVINSFYTNANPPYDPQVDAAAPIPTHFLIRDAFQGAMITPTILPLSTYSAAFTIISAVGGNYVGSTVIVEFINQVSPTNNLILYGVPVDVYNGTYSG